MSVVQQNIITMWIVVAIIATVALSNDNKKFATVALFMGIGYTAVMIILWALATFAG